jgi:hypothetical protein
MNSAADGAAAAFIQLKGQIANRMQKWRTIEAAPRDGSNVLLWARIHNSADASLSYMIGRYDISFGWVATSPSVVPIVPTHWSAVTGRANCRVKDYWFAVHCLAPPKRAVAGLSLRLRSSGIRNAPSEFPALIGPFGLEPCLRRARIER